MKQKPSSRSRRNSTKSILRLPDLEHAKAAVLNSLNSADAKRGATLAANSGFDQPSMIALASSRVLELVARLGKGCRRLGKRSLSKCGLLLYAILWAA
jgi:hypothetical protein